MIAAACTSVRTFTATSSQGLLYAHEQLHRASRERMPLVAVNVNRSILAPWSLETDLADSMSQRDTGWIQLYCSSTQEVMDSVLCAYRIAETTMLPVLECLEGFLLSRTAEVLDVPSQEAVDAFLPAFRAPADWVLDPERLRSFSALPEARDYAAFQRRGAEVLDGAGSVIAAVAAEFAEHFGRRKAGALELAGNRQATRALVTVGTIGDTTQELLADDGDLLVVRVHAYRPFPAAELASALAGAAEVAVVDRVAPFGSLGPLGGDVRSLGLEQARVVADFVCAAGGTDVTPGTLRWILGATRKVDPQQAGRSAIWVPEGVA